MMKKALLVLISLLMVSTACEKTPERESSFDGENSVTEVAIDEEKTDKYVSLDKAREEIAELEGKQYNDITFPEKIAFPEGNEIKKYSAKRYMHVDTDSCEMVLEKFWSDYFAADPETDKINELGKADDKDYKAISVNRNENQYVYSVDTDGFFYGEGMECSMQEHNKIEKVYDFLYGDELDDSEYELNGGSMKVSDAVQMVEEKANAALTDFEKGKFSYKVLVLLVEKNSASGLYDYCMRVGRVVDGISIYPGESIYNTVSTDWGRMFCGKIIDVVVWEKDRIGYVNNRLNSVDIEVQESLQEIISPFYAVSVIKEELATVGIEKFERCGLIYLFGQKSKTGSFGDVEAFDRWYNEDTDLKPYYCFILHENASVKNGQSSFSYSGVVLVDAFSGDCYYFEIG